MGEIQKLTIVTIALVWLQPIKLLIFEEKKVIKKCY